MNLNSLFNEKLNFNLIFNKKLKFTFKLLKFGKAAKVNNYQIYLLAFCIIYRIIFQLISVSKAVNLTKEDIDWY